MIVSSPTERITAEQLLALSDASHLELVDGQLVEKEMGAEASWVAGRVFRRLANWVDERDLGWALPADASYQCFGEDTERVRRPDVSYVRKGRLPGGQLPKGHIRLAPDLVVEVVSPNDLYHDVRRTIGDYLGAGVGLLWVIDPDTRTIEVIENGTPLGWRRCGDALTGGETLPGFSCAVSDLFPPPSTGDTGA